MLICIIKFLYTSALNQQLPIFKRIQKNTIRLCIFGNLSLRSVLTIISKSSKTFQEQKILSRRALWVPSAKQFNMSHKARSCRIPGLRLFYKTGRGGGGAGGLGCLGLTMIFSNPCRHTGKKRLPHFQFTWIYSI